MNKRSVSQDAAGEPVAEIEGDKYHFRWLKFLKGDLPVGTKLYTAPAIPVADTVRQESESTAAYHPNEQAVRAACDLVDKLKGAYDHWEGWSGTPGTCDSIVNLLRYGHEDGAADAQRTDAEGLSDEQIFALLSEIADEKIIARNAPSIIEVGRRLLAARPVSAKPVLTDDQVDALIDPVLRAAGSALKHYAMQKSREDMRTAMRAAIEAAQDDGSKS